MTDPVSGHLLDYGHLTYLPGALTRFIRARDGVCRAPHCTRPATRCQVDHAVPWEVGGPSDTVNCGLLCDRHHPLKTERRISVSNSGADGSLDYTTAWGQSLHVPPRPHLDNPDRYRLGHLAGPEGEVRQADPPPGTNPDPPRRLRLVQYTDNAEPALPFEATTDDCDPPF